MLLLTSLRIGPILRAGSQTNEIRYGFWRLLGKERAGELASSRVKGRDGVA